MNVDIYFNSEKNKLSLKSREPSNFGKTVCHATIAGILNPMFKRSQIARLFKSPNKKLRTFVRGERIRNLNIPQVRDTIEVVYDKKRDAFVNSQTKELVNTATLAVVVGKKIFAHEPRML